MIKEIEKTTLTIPIVMKYPNAKILYKDEIYWIDTIYIVFNRLNIYKCLYPNRKGYPTISTNVKVEHCKLVLRTFEELSNEEICIYEEIKKSLINHYYIEREFKFADFFYNMNLETFSLPVGSFVYEKDLKKK